ncbi:glycine-rich cell wall structural protein-like [Haliotis rubra]|uniref:glycine-rich cell wall structural protein-like n=1 Tax=Haliotis rubra TaxID=36100 RepID=UPI001EE585BD|nr:glycine-rich cell wall structural protein-like [Haliotis rubra]
MAFLAVALLSVISHLALGQGFGQSNTGVGQANAGFGLGQAGGSWGQAGFGVGGIGAGGFGNHGRGIGGAGWGQVGAGFGQNIVNPFLNTTITCTGTATGFAFSATLRRMQPSWGGWGLGRSRSGLTGSAVLRTTTASGTYNLVITERSRVEAGCTADGLGPVIGSNVWGQRQGLGQGWGHGLGQQWGQGLGQGWGHGLGQQWGQGLGQQWGQPWGQQWGQGSLGTGTTTTPGVVSSVTLTTNQETIVDLGTANLPFRELERYGGRGLALCTSLTTGTDGRQVCMEPILACCKLGFDNMDAVTPTPP